MLDAAKIQVGELHTTNWATWKFKVLIALRGLRLLDVVEGKLMSPEKPTELVEKLDPVQQRKYEEDLQKYLSADSAALLLITTNLSQENCEKVLRYTTAREVWQELHRLYDGTSESKTYDLCMKFFSYSMQSGGEVSTHVSKLKNIWTELTRELKKEHLKENLPDLFLICKILDILPEEYFSFKSSWMMMSKEDRTVENLTTQLCNHERALSLSCKNEEKIEALVMRGNRVTKTNQKSKAKVIASTDKCHYCGVIGHRVKGCSKWITDGRPPKSKPTSKSREDPSTSVNNVELMIVNPNATADRDHWFVDNGATSHVTNRKDLYQTFEEFNTSHTVTTANGDTINAVGKGTVIVEADVKGRKVKNSLYDVWYVPSIQKNLFSVLSAQDKLDNSLFMSTTTECKLWQHGKVLIIGERQKEGGLFKLNVKSIRPKSPIEINYISQEDQLQLYHERLAHQSKAHVKKVMERELGIKLKLDREICEGCMYGKAHKLKFGTRERAKEPGELIHGDVCGPFINSLSKNKYFVLFKDDFSKFRYVYFLRAKSEVHNKLELMLAEVQTTGHKVRELLSDNGGEFDNENVRRILQKYGIKQRLTMPHTPNQNGCVERENRTVVEAMRTMMHTNDLPQSLWAELVDTAVYILNRTGPTTLDKSPYEIWYSKKPRIKHLRIIGSTCYAHIPKITRKKLDKKSVKGVLVGYDNDEGYRVWVREKSKIIRSRDVIFEEKTVKCCVDMKDVALKEETEQPTKPNNKIIIPGPIIELLNRDKVMKVTEENDTVIETENDIVIENDIELEESDPEDSEDEMYKDCSSENHTEQEVQTESNQEIESNVQEQEIEIESRGEIESNIEQGGMRLRDRSTLRKPARFDDFVMSMVAELNDEIVEPQTFKEAMESKEKKKWIIAMKEEMKSLNENETWKMVPLPKGRKAISCKWIYKIKRNPDGSVERYKARLVIKGYSQKKGVDYYETFSPVAKMSTIRTILSIAARDNMHLSQFDVSTAFLYGSIDEEIFMKPPEGYNDNTGLVCKLTRSLYGLKQAPRCWNNCIQGFLQNVGFKQSEADPCLFVRRREEKMIILALYVDDGLIACSDEEEAQRFLTELKERFKIKSKSANYYLGLEISREDDGTVKINQTAYTKKVLERFGMSECKPVGTPIIKDGKLEKGEDKDSKTEKFPYRQVVGALAYLMVGTRPDIAYAVGVASRKLDYPSSEDIIKVKRILRYLRGTLDWGLIYKRKSDAKLRCYSDSDHGGDLETGRSTSGMICTYAGGIISWKSNRQASVAISSTEAEVVAASETAREIIWLRRLFESIEHTKYKPVLYVDNESAIKLARNPPYEYHSRTKHIRIREFFIREAVTDGELDVAKVSSEFQLADMMTKPLYRPRLTMLCKRIGMLGREDTITG